MAESVRGGGKMSKATNFEFPRTLSAEEYARLFVRLRNDAAEEADWLEWMKQPVNKDEWKEILK